MNKRLEEIKQQCGDIDCFGVPLGTFISDKDNLREAYLVDSIRALEKMHDIFTEEGILTTGEREQIKLHMEWLKALEAIK